MKLIIQPDDGVAPILEALQSAKKSIEIVIFRFDLKEIETELKSAVERGVFVYALIAYANHGGEARLRDLEMSLLEAGVTVARTAHDLLRYHDKMLLIDRRTVYVFSFNYTTSDLEKSRGFGVATSDPVVLEQAARLFEADAQRRQYVATADDFVVSPLNARKQLTNFIKNAGNELLIYDPKISDSRMIRLLSEQYKAGVDIKIIGSLGKQTTALAARKLAAMRLHTRTIVRDRSEAYIGSGSLRRTELDARREVGLIVHDAGIVRTLIEKFESDWAASAPEAKLLRVSGI